MLPCSPEEELESPKVKRRSLCDSLLDPDRIQALQDCDQNLLTYDPSSFWLVFSLHGRNFRIIALPIYALILWDVCWGLLLITAEDPGDIAVYIRSMDKLITPVLTPVSFLMVFRLSRAAVRYWDARAAMGKLVEICRATASIAIVGCRGRSDPMLQGATDPSQYQQHLHQQELAEEFVRWIAVFPLAVKNFLRPWEQCCNRMLEMGDVLSPLARQEMLEAKGDTLLAPILVLDRVRELSCKLAYANMTHTLLSNPHHEAALSGALYCQLNLHVDTLTGAWGAMERINATPLPFVYVVHLRTFLLLYLFLWHIVAIASNGWIAILPLQLASWGLLGIEAAAVECERPFQRNSNHLALGKAGIVVARNLAQTWKNFDWTSTASSQNAKPFTRSTVDETKVEHFTRSTVAETVVEHSSSLPVAAKQL
jgi:ion channel-forming bestrophin family protein